MLSKVSFLKQFSYTFAIKIIALNLLYYEYRHPLQAMLNMKIVNILIGQKGSGKTYIGELLQDKLNIAFLRVEDLCLKIKAGRQITDKNYVTEVFQEIESEIRHQLKNKNELTIESTASVIEFDTMLSHLKKDFIVKLIKIDTNPALCIDRVKNRNKVNHVAVSDDMVVEINNLSNQKKYDFDLIINNNDTTNDIILNSWKQIDQSTACNNAFRITKMLLNF